jgi:hypothetical protein
MTHRQLHVPSSERSLSALYRRRYCTGVDNASSRQAFPRESCATLAVMISARYVGKPANPSFACGWLTKLIISQYCLLLNSLVCAERQYLMAYKLKEAHAHVQAAPLSTPKFMI